MPVVCTRHALDTACARSRELAHAVRAQVAADIKAEVREAVRAGRVFNRKPIGARRREQEFIHYATTEDGRRTFVLRVVEDGDGALAWRVLTVLTPLV